jgi:hypothetical protein
MPLHHCDLGREGLSAYSDKKLLAYILTGSLPFRIICEEVIYKGKKMG